MSLISLLFDEKHQYLGELATKEGVLQSFILTQIGEAAIGEHVKEWQTQGVPMFRETVEKVQDKISFIMFQDRVQVRNQMFLDALRIWFGSRNHHVITVHQPVLDCWQIMLALPLSDHERFAMVYALCRVPENEIDSWRKALAQSIKAVDDVKS